MAWTKEDAALLARTAVVLKSGIAPPDDLLPNLGEQVAQALAHIEALEARVAELEAGLVGPEARKRAENIYMCRVRSALGITGSECSELTRLRAVCAEVAGELREHYFGSVLELATRLDKEAKGGSRE